MNTVSSQNDVTVSRQWASRPDDQRFLTLEDLKKHVETRRQESWTAAPKMSDIRMVPSENNGLGVELYDPTAGQRRTINPTNWGFNQLSQYANAPGSYLKTLPSELAAINLQWGFENNPKREDGLFLARSNGTHELRAITSASYGRIWDIEVVRSVEKVNQNGNWVIPSSSYSTTNPKRATTLYSSDRDVFIFLVDPNHPIEVPGESSPLFRGFYTYNSEVGSATFGIKTFLYRYVCDNRIIWGMTDVRELKIRHTGGAPERFEYEGSQYLQQYANESQSSLVSQITKAKQSEPEIDKTVKREVGLTDWLTKRGFTKSFAKSAIENAQAEEGEVRSVWDIIQGITATARGIPHQDQRTEIEEKAGKLMAQFRD